MRTSPRVLDRNRRRAPLASCAVAVLLFAGATASARAQTLEGRAVLPADTFADGPLGTSSSPPMAASRPSWARSRCRASPRCCGPGSANTWRCPTTGSARRRTRRTTWLRVYRIRPDFLTRSRGTGAIQAEPLFTLRDPDRKINFTIVADREGRAQAETASLTSLCVASAAPTGTTCVTSAARNGTPRRGAKTCWPPSAGRCSRRPTAIERRILAEMLVAEGLDLPLDARAQRHQQQTDFDANLQAFPRHRNRPGRPGPPEGQRVFPSHA
jgi:hypothetical protein